MPDESSSFFCRPLKNGALCAGQFTSIVSMISCALAFAVFFRESSADDGPSKLLSFAVACYAIYYIFMSRSLIRGIKDERRDKFICWIIMSVGTVILLLSGIIYIIILFAAGKFEEDSLMAFAVLAITALYSALAGIIVYCIWGVVTLWRLYGGSNVEGVNV